MKYLLTSICKHYANIKHLYNIVLKILKKYCCKLWLIIKLNLLLLAIIMKYYYLNKIISNKFYKLNYKNLIR